MKTLSTNHVNQQFNYEVQSYCLFVEIKQKSYTVHNFICMGIACPESIIVDDRKGTTLIKSLDSIWICNHAIPESISAYDEFNRIGIVTELTARGLRLKARPSRRDSKLGII